MDQKSSQENWILAALGYPIWIIALAPFLILALVFSGTVASAQKPSALNKGQFEFKQGGKTYIVPMGLPGTLQASPAGEGKVDLNLIYMSVNKPGQPNISVIVSLAGLRGPGKYANNSITSFGLKVGKEVDWLFLNSQYACTFTFTSVTPTHVEGTVSCSAKGGGRVPWSDGHFTALP